MSSLRKTQGVLQEVQYVQALSEKICFPGRDSRRDQIELVKRTGDGMGMTDPLADMFARIQNGAKAKFEKVDIPSSKLKKEVVRVLRDEGYIKNFRVITGERPHEILRIFLKYDSSRKGIFRVKRISKPGKRVYVGTDKIPSVMGGLGTAILSTPKGILTDKASREAHVGGEVLCHLW